MDTFVSIDFETANSEPNSACALAMILVEGGKIRRKEVHLIQPPSRTFTFTGIHGITWKDVSEERSFGEVWLGVREMLKGARYLVAHNASFDRRVLAACCEKARLPLPPLPFVCTVQVARAVWNIRPTKLPNVCARLGIGLKHHDAGSDAEACAHILVAAFKAGWQRKAP